MDQDSPPFVLSAPAPEVSSTTIVFNNARPQFCRLVFRGALLELITLGIYRFWLATDIRRHLWSHTSVDGDALEYTGTGWELLLGFILALGILGPIYLVYFLIGLEAERLQAFASIPIGLFFYLFAEFAIYRARRYRLTRTIWRGVRFWMTGSGWNYAFRAFGWSILVILTLGLLLPWREASLERYKMRHSHYGDLQGQFDGTGWEFFKQGVWLWLLAIFLLAVVTIGLTVPKTPSPAVASVPTLLSIGGPFFYGGFKAIQWRWWVSGCRFGEVRFKSTLPATELFGVYWKTIGWSWLISSIALIVIASVVLADAAIFGSGENFKQKFFSIFQHVHLFVAIAVFYIAAALIYTAVVRIYLIHDVALRVAQHTTVVNVAAAEDVAGRGEAANAIGEGLAASLDLSFGF